MNQIAQCEPPQEPGSSGGPGRRRLPLAESPPWVVFPQAPIRGGQGLLGPVFGPFGKPIRA